MIIRNTWISRELVDKAGGIDNVIPDVYYDAIYEKAKGTLSSKHSMDQSCVRFLGPLQINSHHIMHRNGNRSTR